MSTVPPGGEIVTEVGSFLFMAPQMTTAVELTLCSKKGCGEGWGRICGGESCVKVFLRNESSDTGYAGITPNFPAKILPIKFGTTTPPGATIIAQGGAIMSQMGDVDVDCHRDCNCATCCCAGLGCCRQKITASDDSIAFLAVGGTVVYKVLKDGETIIVDSNSVVAFEDTVELGIRSNGRFCTCCCGGEGCFSTTLTGPGQIWMQSMSFNKFQAAVQQTVYEEMDRGDSGTTGGGGWGGGDAGGDYGGDGGDYGGGGDGDGGGE